MKRTVVLAISVMMAWVTVSAQSAIELAKKQKELNEINMKMLNAKPSKDAKKQAKALKKEGWAPVGSSKAIEKQITEDQLLSEVLMIDESGNPTRRYIQHSATAVAGTQNAAYAAARAACQTEIAAILATKVAGAMQQKIDNQQSSAISATTIDKFHERTKSIIDACLTHMVPGMNIYRVLANNNYESQVTISYDKMELINRLKRYMQQYLEMEGDEELNDIVDQVLSQDI